MPAPENLIIDTPEQIRLEFALAGVGSRFLALAIDMLLQMAIGLLVLAAVAGTWSLMRPRAGGPPRRSNVQVIDARFGHGFSERWAGPQTFR